MGLQLDTDAGVPAQQGLEEEVCVFFELVQVGLGAPVQPVELLGSERNVQQAGFAQDVVGVTEALPLDVSVAVTESGLSWWAVLLGGPPRNDERLVLGARGVRDGQQSGQLRLADSGRRPLFGRTAAGARFCWSD